ncbi:uncharacterized protein LOC18428129 [Amborella trichopoda]|uniref:DUF4228 domain-containing protein n=1 Tax=Amborella trichopoda TaxID=13333 RepID=W1NZE8_AMBTC|nr:uncharacterized protein LOC18428129 [Amborella trichopoda]ERN00085.1 hypothetical protein AMTR_s00105p00148840 [Amborella trichopoda]|eukprot:XP_006837231.1 uncharacterized protein LOC18428129 [Amborella trichopoda]
MGNYISCASTGVPSKNSGVKVVLSDGSIRRFDRPVKAAELMLEAPNHFLSNSKSVHLGRRFSPIPADEDLDMGEVYFMFPMRRANSMVSPADMAGMLMRADKAIKKTSGGLKRVLPEIIQEEDYARKIDSRPTEIGEVGNCGGEVNFRRPGFEEVEDFPMGFNHRLSMCRSRKPRLETINEEATVCSR